MSDLGAQIGEALTNLVTVLLFFWLMKIFAWKPLQALLADRQKQISDGFAEIDHKNSEASRLLAEHTAKIREIDQEARAKILEAVNDGRRVAAEMVEAARKESAQLTERAQQNIQMEIAKARKELRAEVVSLAIGASERLMRERLEREDSSRLVSAFIDDLEKIAR